MSAENTPIYSSASLATTYIGSPCRHPECEGNRERRTANGNCTNQSKHPSQKAANARYRKRHNLRWIKGWIDAGYIKPAPYFPEGWGVLNGGMRMRARYFSPELLAEARKS